MTTRAMALAGLVAGLALPAAPASADHGFDTFRFTNKMTGGKKAHDIWISFGAQSLSHVEKHDWRGAKCRVLKAAETGLGSNVVRCKGGDALLRNDNFEVSVAPPPPHTQLKIQEWWWTGKDGDRVSRKYQSCRKSPGCRDVADS